MRACWILALGATGCLDHYDLPPRSDVPIVAYPGCAPPREERVVCTLDGDTFDLGRCGQDLGERVRMLAIDAPEIAHPGNDADCGGPEAEVELRRILENRTVTLEFDDDCADIYGRTLAYVWLEGDDARELAEDAGEDGFDDGDVGSDDLLQGTSDVPRIMVNEYMLKTGFARRFIADFVGELRFQDRINAAEEYAKDRAIGVWSDCN